MIVTLRCGRDETCTWSNTDEYFIAASRQRQHERGHDLYGPSSQLRAPRDVQASPAWSTHALPEER